MDHGHVHLMRKIWKNRVLKEPGRKFSRLEAWLWIVSMEAKGLDDRRSGLKRGEFSASLRTLAKTWKWSRSAVQRFLKDLQAGDDPMIKSLGQQTGHFTEHFIVCKYGTYNPIWDGKRDSKRDILKKDIKKDEIKDSRPATAARILFDIYREENTVLRGVREFTSDRERQCRARLKNAKNVKAYLNDFRDAVRHAQDCPFMRGEGERHWVASFDFFIENDKNVYKVLEGNYDGDCRRLPGMKAGDVGASDDPPDDDPAKWTEAKWTLFERVNGAEAARALRQECGKT